MSSGFALMLVGLVIIAGLPLPATWRGPIVVAWCAACGRELRQLGNAYRQYRAVRVFSDGTIELRGAEATVASAQLLPGSIVLPGLAWLRLRLENGRTSGELLRGNIGEDEDWRRLQVIWRHLGAAR
jgi:hypothetical protein